MAEKIKIAIIGAGGRMGKMLVQTVDADEQCALSGAVDMPGHPAIGSDAGINAGVKKSGIAILESLSDYIGASDVLIDFTSPENTIETVRIARECKKALVIGATGITPEQQKIIDAAAHDIPIIQASNYSVGVTLLLSVVEETARKLGAGYDIEIVEAHHHDKKDAPSGTAKSLAEAAAKGRGLSLDECGVYGRKGIVGARGKDEIGVMAVRGGDVVGDHTVGFYGVGERIEIKHQAHSRMTFATGAVRAAKWLCGKKPKMYSMRDVLGL